jgi:exodeoxyribonuclease VII small subunit
MTATPPKDLAYSEALTELESLVEELEDGDADLDVLASRFERAIEIIEELDGRITKTQKQVEKLMPRLDRAVSEDD